jgi:hypothetical protein
MGGARLFFKKKKAWCPVGHHASVHQTPRRLLKIREDLLLCKEFPRVFALDGWA